MHGNKETTNKHLAHSVDPSKKLYEGSSNTQVRFTHTESTCEMSRRAPSDLYALVVDPTIHERLSQLIQQEHPFTKIRAN